MDFARTFFAPLHGNFQQAMKEGKVVTCLLIQALLIEAFAISAYHIYIPVADPFARKITEGVVKTNTPISTTARSGSKPISKPVRTSSWRPTRSTSP